MRPHLERLRSRVAARGRLTRPSRPALIGAALGLALLLGSLSALMRGADEPTTTDFGDRVPGQRIYDQTGLLSSDDLLSLDRRAAAIERAGIPVVVYIRPVDDRADDTRSDAQSLMRSWAVETRPGAADGLVLFLDVDQRDAAVDPDHVVLFPGDQLKRDRLPAIEAQRISAGSVRGLTTVVDTSRELAATVNFNLAATERRLALGFPVAPGPSVAERTATTIVRYLIPVVSAVLALLAMGVVAAIWRGRPRPAACPAPDATHPESPVLRAALAANRVDQSVLLAAIDRLAQQGAVLVVGPARTATAHPAGPGCVRLLDRERALDGIDRAAWDDLAMVSTAGIVDEHGLTRITHRSGPFSRAVTTELEGRGWWDAMAPRRAGPLVLMSQALLVAGGVTLVVALAVGEILGLVAIVLLVLTAAVAWACAQAYPRATPLGLAVAGRGPGG